MAKESNQNSKNIFRPEKGRIVGGVCLALANYFDIDPVITRVLFLLVTIWGGSGVLIYIILWLAIPSEKSIGNSTEDNIKEGADEIKTTAQKFGGGNRNVLAGIILLALGLGFLLGNFGIINGLVFSKLWPLILIVLGIVILTKHGKE